MHSGAASHCSRVDFPLPSSPIRAALSPGFSVRAKSSSSTRRSFLCRMVRCWICSIMGPSFAAQQTCAARQGTKKACLRYRGRHWTAGKKAPMPKRAEKSSMCCPALIRSNGKPARRRHPVSRVLSRFKFGQSFRCAWKFLSATKLRYFVLLQRIITQSFRLVKPKPVHSTSVMVISSSSCAGSAAISQAGSTGVPSSAYVFTSPL